MTLWEQVVYSDTGRMLTDSFQKYRLPTRVDAPRLTVEFAESWEPSGPYGAKSVGEIGIDTPPAALANALWNAVGIRLRELPLTPEKILHAIRKKG
jgi:CO/xanthine dehydrogenase Mo-binding subunit